MVRRLVAGGGSDDESDKSTANGDSGGSASGGTAQVGVTSASPSGGGDVATRDVSRSSADGDAYTERSNEVQGTGDVAGETVEETETREATTDMTSTDASTAMEQGTPRRSIYRDATLKVDVTGESGPRSSGSVDRSGRAGFGGGSGFGLGLALAVIGTLFAALAFGGDD